MSSEHGLHEAMDRLCDRLRACSALINHPSLVPGGTSVLAQVLILLYTTKYYLLAPVLVLPHTTEYYLLAQVLILVYTANNTCSHRSLY